MWCKGNAHMQEWKHKENMKAKSESIACNNNEVWPSQTVKFCKARVEAAAFCGPNKKQPSPFSLSLFLTIYAGRELLSSGQRRSSKTRRGRRGRGGSHVASIFAIPKEFIKNQKPQQNAHNPLFFVSQKTRDFTVEPNKKGSLNFILPMGQGADEFT